MKLYHVVIALLLACLCIAPAAAADADPIVGEWNAKGAIPFLFFSIPCGSGTAELNADGTGVVSGSVKLLFLDLMSVENEPLTWKKTSENLYSITVMGTSVPVKYVPDEDALTGSVSTGQFGIAVDVTVSGTATRA